jgi:phage terminase large subunit-like protein
VKYTYRGFLRFCEQVDLHLEQFQRKLARAAFGEQSELLCLLPRGQGKSRLVGTLAVFHLLTVERAAVYIAAASRDQARVVFEYARDVAQHELVADQVVVRHLELRGPDDGFLRVLASDAALLHGLTPSLSIMDELHAFAKPDVYVAMRTALLKRSDSRMIVISTAAQGAETPLGQLRARALSQPLVRHSGALTEAYGESLAMLSWAVPDDGNVDNPRVVKRANPASWITEAQLREQRQALHDLDFRRYHANQWTAQEGAWLTPGTWQACAGDAHVEPGEKVWVGVDVGGSRSASAVVWVTDDLRVNSAVYEGDGAVLDCAEKVRELAAAYAVVEVVHDPWRFQQAALELEQEGLLVVAFPQSNPRLIPASERLRRAVTEGRLTHPNDPTLNRHVANAIAKDTPRGWRIDKAHRAAHIDAVIALAMALERAEQKPEPVRLLGWL